MKKHAPFRRQNSAFTLIEIMLVVMIIAVLAGAAIGLLRGNVDQAKFTVVDTDVKNIATQIQMYEVQNGTMPSTEQGLKALVTRPTGDPQPRRWRQLMPSVPLDPWGMEYQFRNPGTKSKEGYDMFSCGKDRKPNTDDDIGNW